VELEKVHLQTNPVKVFHLGSAKQNDVRVFNCRGRDVVAKAHSPEPNLSIHILMIAELLSALGDLMMGQVLPFSLVIRDPKAILGRRLTRLKPQRTVVTPHQMDSCRHKSDQLNQMTSKNVGRLLILLILGLL
jgi:hypothetical protein